MIVTLSGRFRRWVVCRGVLWVIFPPLDDYVSPAPHRGSPDPPPDQEMAEGRRPRGRRMVGDGEGDSAGLGDFAAARECLPALRFRPWVQHWWKRRATGEVIVVRYADDSVLGFQYRAEAERFLQEWRERLQKFGLELHPDKTRLDRKSTRLNSSHRTISYAVFCLKKKNSIKHIK